MIIAGLRDYAVSMFSRPPPAVRFSSGHPMSPGAVLAPVGVLSGPTSLGEGDSGPGKDAPVAAPRPLTPTERLERAAASLHRCEEVARRAAGDRAHDVYCHYLPAGHAGACEPQPTAERMALAWHAALLARVQRST